MRNKLKILNDPIYGFITIPNERIFDIIEHPYFQRLRRITQMGMSYMVYPGAHHSRFHHALGCMHLMGQAVEVLRFKGVEISDEEKEALEIAILLHDIGHGPFSHAMEHSVVNGVSHESISLRFMEKMNREFNQSLTLAIQIFKGEYHRQFFHQLISSQLDIDRLDYLKRDSFYTGVAEGNINSKRLIVMLNVQNDQLVIEEKGIYSVEKFLVARRLMYWQVYFHKTSLGAEQLLTRMLQRAKDLVQQGTKLPASKSLTYFLEHKIDQHNFTDKVLDRFSRLDDYDIVSAMKMWMDQDDFVLRELCEMLINRDLLKVKMQNTPISQEVLAKKLHDLQQKYNLTSEEASYFVFTDKVTQLAYDHYQSSIDILYKDGSVKDVAKASDQFNIEALSNPVIKYYICYPKAKY